MPIPRAADGSWDDNYGGRGSPDFWRRAQGPAAARLKNETAFEGQRGVDLEAGVRGTRGRLDSLLDSGHDSLDEWTRGAVSAGMPQFERSLQGVREGAIRRGAGLGDLGTSYEGDLASAFERNITNAVSSQAMNLYNTKVGTESDLYRTDVDRAESSRNRYMDALTGERDYDTAQENARRKRRSGLFGGIGALVGGVGGFLVGGPAGAAAGASAGSSLGSGIGG